jgi:hypothetical protein
MDGHHREWMGTILSRKPLCCKHFGTRWERLGSLAGGEGVSQSPLKGKAFSTFLGQKPPFELRRKLAFRLQSFHEIHRGSSNWTNPSISVGGGQQDWLAFALRRQRSHARIVSGAPTTLRRDFDYLLTI